MQAQTSGVYERSIAYCIVYKWLFEVSQTISRQRPPLCCFCSHNLSEYLNCLRTWITAGYFISILTNANITNILLFLENHEPGAPLFIIIWCWTICKTKQHLNMNVFIQILCKAERIFLIREALTFECYL